MKKLLSAIILAVLPFVVSGQSVLTGKVVSATDSTAVVGATVMATGGYPNTMCNAEGIFTLEDVPAGELAVEVHMLGFRSVTFDFNVRAGRNDAGLIVLAEALNEIEEVVVRSAAQMAVQKGDTTQFNAAAFKTHPDADADELLVKIPGVVIQDGRIEAQGEPVRRIYVDGKLLFSTDPMAALRTVPADAVESIQLFDDVSEEARFTGFDDGETVKAINIVTKTKTNETIIFKTEASAGTDTGESHNLRYQTGADFSWYKDRHRVTVTGLVNNVNTTKFGQSDLNASGIDDKGNPVNPLQGVRKIAGGGVNYSYEDEAVKFSSNYLFDDNRDRIERVSLVNYYPKPPSFDSKDVFRNTLQRNVFDRHRFNTRLEWKINRRNIVVLTTRFEGRSDDNTSDVNTLTIRDGDSLNRYRIVTPADVSSYNFSVGMVWTHRFEKRGRTLTTNLSMSGSGRDLDRRQHYESNENYRNGGWVTPANTIDREYDQRTRNNSGTVKATYSEPFAERHRVLLNVSAGKEWGEDDKQVNRYDRDGNFIGKDARQTSNFKRDYSSYGGGVGYAYQSKTIRLSAGTDYILLDQQRDEREPNLIVTDRSFRDLRPNAMLRYTMDKSRYLRVNYQGRTILPRIDYMQDVIDDSSPSNVRIGNPDLSQAYQHRLTLFYNSANKQKNSNLTLTLEGRTISDYIAQRTEAIEGDSIYLEDRGEWYVAKTPGAFISRYENMDGYVFIKTEGTYSFPWKAIRSNINFRLSYNYIRSPSVYTMVNYANIHKTGVRLGITSNISQNVDFNFYSHTTLSNTVNSSKENTSYTNQNLYLSNNIIFARRMVVNTLFSWRYYHGQGLSAFSDSYCLLNVGVGRKLFGKQNGEVRVTAYDLLNQNKNIQYYVRDNNTENTTTNTLGRYVLARFMYRFNSISHGKAAKRKNVAGDNYQTIKPAEIRSVE